MPKLLFIGDRRIFALSKQNSPKLLFCILFLLCTLFSCAANKNRDDGNITTQNKKGQSEIKTNIIADSLDYDQITAYTYSEGLIIVEKDYQCGFMDLRTAELVIPCVYQNAYPFNEGLACVVVKGNKIGLIDKTGEIAIPCIYDESTWRFKEGSIGVRKGSKWGFVDRNGETVIPFEFDSAESFSEGLALVSGKGKYAFIDKFGNTAISLADYAFAYSFANGYAVVHKNGKNGLINKEGKLVVPLIHDHITNVDVSPEYPKGLACVANDGKVGYVDIGKDANKTIDMEYDHIPFFAGEFASVAKNGKWGVVDRNNGIVVPFEYDFISESFESYGFAVAAKNGKYGCINQNNEIVMPFVYERLMPKGGYLHATIKEKFDEQYNPQTGEYEPVYRNSEGFIDKNENIIVPFGYYDWVFFVIGEDNIYIMRKEGKWTILEIIQ